MDELLPEFLAECLDGLAALDAELIALEARPGDAGRVANIFRTVHTIKGTCGFLGLPRLERIAHAAEGVLDPVREGRLAPTPATVSAVLATVDRVRLILDGLATTRQEPPGDDGELLATLEGIARDTAAGAAAPAALAVPSPTGGEDAAGGGVPRTVRVRLDLLDRLTGVADELVFARDELLRHARRDPGGRIAGPLGLLDRVAAELHETVAQARMQPIGSAWACLPRLVRDLGLELGKEVELELHGGDLGLGREVLEAIRGPLVHIARNAVDHGLEPPEERRARGKPARGLLRLTASRDGGHVLVRVADDGRGLDTAAIRAKALASGLAGEAELGAMAPGAIHRFILQPGFSTAARVSGVSGRGVGLDVVRADLERIGGTVEIESEPGRGTSLTLRLPRALGALQAAATPPPFRAGPPTPRVVPPGPAERPEEADSATCGRPGDPSSTRHRGRPTPLMDVEGRRRRGPKAAGVQAPRPPPRGITQAP